MKPRGFKFDADILSQKITLINECIQNIESEQQHYDYKFLTVRKKKKSGIPFFTLRPLP